METTHTHGVRDLAARIVENRILILDGATGTELERRGVPSELPLWSALALARAPEAVAAIHADYAAAGADILTANTFRSQRRTLARGGWGERAAELTERAVDLARTGAARGGDGRSIYVVGSAPPLEDCYRPGLVPDDDALAREHAEHAQHLAAAGADAVLVETMNCVREAVAATHAAHATGLPVLVSFVCWDGARLLSGEPLAEALDAVLREEPIAVLVNCLPPSNVAACVPPLRETGAPFGVYANLGAPVDSATGERSEPHDPASFAEIANTWRELGARVVGGCCGTTPEHISALATHLRN